MNEVTFKIEAIATLPDGNRFQAVPTDYEPGVPIGYGKDIREAIESLLESWEMKYDEQLLNYKWN